MPTRRQEYQNTDSALPVMPANRRDHMAPSQHMSPSAADDDLVTSALPSHSPLLNHPHADSGAQQKHSSSKRLKRRSTRSASSLPTIQTAVAAPIVHAKKVAVKGKKPQVKETFDDISPISPLSPDEPVTPESASPPRPVTRKVRGVEFEMMNTSSTRLSSSEILLKNAAQNTATSRTMRKVRSQIFREKSGEDVAGKTEGLEQSMRKLRISRLSANDAGAEHTTSKVFRKDSREDALHPKPSWTKQNFRESLRNRINRKSVSTSTDSSSDDSSSDDEDNDIKGAPTDILITSTYSPSSPTPHDIPLSYIGSSTYVMPPIHNPHVLFRRHWTSLRPDSSRPLEDWAPSKRWVCHVCGAQTIVEQWTCANLACQHTRCFDFCLGPRREGEM